MSLSALVKNSLSSPAVSYTHLFNALIKVQQVLAACEKELGFTPVSRARVKADPKDEEQNEYDGF